MRLAKTFSKKNQKIEKGGYQAQGQQIHIRKLLTTCSEYFFKASCHLSGHFAKAMERTRKQTQHKESIVKERQKSVWTQWSHKYVYEHQW